MADEVLFQPRAKRRQAKYRGPTDAAAFNDTMDELVSDHGDLAASINALHVRTSKEMMLLQEQIHHLNERVAELEEGQSQDEAVLALNGGTITYRNNFRDTKDIDFDAFVEERRCRLDPLFGQVTLPINGASNRFHAVDYATQEIVLPSDLSAVATPVAEYGGIVVEGTPRNAFNGQPNSIYVRQVLLPLYSDVEKVTFQFDIEVPARFSTLANCIYLIPYPLGTMDIESILYSSTVADPSTPLLTFPTEGVRSCEAVRYLFPTVNITKLRITASQSHWTEYKDQKLFMYGFQEIGAMLCEFDQTDVGAYLSNNAFEIVVDCPEGYDFNLITDFGSDSGYATVGNLSGIYFNIYADAAHTTLLWDSWADPNPRAVNVNCAPHAVDRLYIVGVLRYLTATAITPILNSMYMRYTTL